MYLAVAVALDRNAHADLEIGLIRVTIPAGAAAASTKLAKPTTAIHRRVTCRLSRGQSFG